MGSFMKERSLIKPDIDLINYIKKEGGGALKKCFQCATCSVTCSLSTEENEFPRKQILMAQWGLKDRLLEDPAPWLCYYCGDCSKRCPRQANPGENMMALRRYLTSLYDWTGLSRLMYRSVFWELGIFLIVAAAIFLLFTIPNDFGFGLLSRSDPAALTTVMLDKFAPVDIVDVGDRIMAVLLGLLLLSNAFRMIRGLTRNEKIPFSLYFTQIPSLILHGVTQKRWKECDESDSQRNWMRHLFLVSGYVIMLTLVVVFLPLFQVKDSSLHWTAMLGYYATTVLLISTAWIIFDRMKGNTEMHRFSQFSDWLFPVLLFLSALSGILLHIFRVSDMAMVTYYTYMIHMMIVVPMLVVEVPFGKWGHLLYRPVAIYAAAIKNKAKEMSEQQSIGREETAATI